MIEFTARLANVLVNVALEMTMHLLRRFGDIPPFGVLLGPDERPLDTILAAQGEDEAMPADEAGWRKADALVQATLQSRAKAAGVIAFAQVTRLETTQGMMVGVQMHFGSSVSVALVPYRQGPRGWEFGQPVPWQELLVQPPQLDFRPPLTAEAQKYLDDACVELDKLQGLFDRRWRTEAPHTVRFDLERSCLLFSFGDGRGVEAQAEILGTYRPGDRSWNWAWDQGDIARFAAGGALVRSLGQRFGVEYLTRPAYQVPDPSFLGLLVAVGVKATNSIGHYVARHTSEGGEMEVFYLLKGAKTKAPA